MDSPDGDIHQPLAPGSNPQGAPTVVIQPGGCPNCQIGMLSEEFTCPGICLAICCFPLGLICCFLLKEKKCANCGTSF